MLVLRVLLLTFLWDCAHGTDSDAEASTIAALQRDVHLDAPLHELLRTPLAGDQAVDLDTRLQRAFVQCRELGVTSIVYDTGSEAEGALDAEDVAYCNRLRYVRHQRQRMRDVWKELETTEDVKMQVDTRTIDDVSFQDFFEVYAEKTQPVVLQLKETVAQLLGLDNGAEEAAEKEIEQFLSVCFGVESKQGSVDGIVSKTLRVEDEKCAAMLGSTFRVPIFMTHDYVQRTNASRAEAFLPAIVELPPASSNE
ncbi:hypothetical protein PHMEG_00039519, partial [Phytophthora megakarya]